MHYNKEDLLNSSVVATVEFGTVVAAFGRVESLDEKATTIKEKGLTYDDINNDVTLEKTEEKLKRALNFLMYAMFNLNKAYHNATHKYLMGRKEVSLETAKEIYDALLRVI